MLIRIRKRLLQGLLVLSMVLGLLPMLTLPVSAATLLTVDFETAGSGYTVQGDIAPASSTCWERTDGSVISPDTAFTLNQGSYYFYGENTDSPANDQATKYVMLDAYDVTNYSDLQMKILIAGNNNTITNYEGDEFLKIQYAYDGGQYTTRAQFIASSVNVAYLTEDANADGTTDGTNLSPAFTEFTYSIPKSGSSLQIRIAANIDQGSEEIGFDNIRISGTKIAQPGVDIWDGTIATGFSGGDGSVGNPYLIATGEQLAYLASLTNTQSTNDTANKYYKLTADIDLDNNEWTPIGIGLTGTQFLGTFDGDGHIISNLSMTNSESRAGLFGQISYSPISATIKNVGVVNINISGHALNSVYAGGLVGSISVTSTIENCYTTGTITTGTHASNRAGGLIGQTSFTGGGILNCYSTVNVASSGGWAGGMIASHSAPLTSCYASGTIKGVRVSDMDQYGGFYARYAGGSTSNSFWNANATAIGIGQLSGSGGAGYPTGKTSAELMAPDFPNTLGAAWKVDNTPNDNQGYPILNGIGCGRVGNAAPTAANVQVSGAANVGQTLTGSYTYNDAEGDSQGTSTFKWYRSDNASGLNKAQIFGQTASTYPLTSDDLGKYISFEVTPVASAGTSPGTAGESPRVGPVSLKAQAAVVYNDVTKTYGDTAFAHTATGGSGTGMFNYASSDTSVATIDAATGSVVILKEGDTTLTATRAGDAEYEPASDTCTLHVDKKLLNATATADNKTYNAIGTAAGSITLVGVLEADAGQVTASGTFTFEDASAGDGKTVNVTGIALAGAKSGNYTLNGVTAASTTANISKKILTVTATASNKPYDGSTSASGNIVLAAVEGADAGQVTAGGTFAFEDAAVGDGKTVNVTGIALTGAKSGNYTLNGSTTASTTANITKADITGITFSNATVTYDGTVKTLVISGTLPTGASVSYLNNTGINAGTKNAAANINGGANYNNATLNATLTINKADITGIAFSNSTVTYDGSEKSLVISGDLPTGASVAYVSNTGTNAAIYNATANITGGDNYNNTSLNATLTIQKAQLTATVGNYVKIYGQANPAFTVEVTGFVNGENAGTADGYIAPTAGSLATATTDVGTSAITISGGSATDYSFDISDAGVLNINPKILTPTATADNKIYNGSNGATGTIHLTDIEGADAGQVTASGTFAFEDASVEDGKTVNVTGITLAGTKSGNYTLNGVTTALTTADITSKTLTFTVSANDKAYDGNVTATGTIALNGAEGTDDVAASGTFAFTDAAVGVGKTVNVTDITLNGADAGNYTLGGITTGSTTATITKQVQSISVSTLPIKTTYGYGEALDVTGGVVTITYNDASTETTALTDAMCQLAATPTIGFRVVNVTYLTKTDAFNVTYTKANQVTPAAPTLDVTALGITVTTPSGGQYEYSRDGGTTWQSDANFTGLTHNTAYTITARLKETSTHHASNASVGTGATFMDSTSPSLTAGTVTRTGDTAGTVRFTSDEAGSYYFTIVDDGAAEPVISTTGAGVTCTTSETTITDPAGLTAGAKDVYIKVKDAAGNVSNALKIDIAPYMAPDLSAPSLTAGVVSRTSDTQGSVKFTSDEAGSYYFTIVDDGAAEPVISTTGAGVTCTTSETTIIDPAGLTAGAKDIYIKVKDAAGNISNALKIDIPTYTSSGGGSSGGSSSSDNSEGSNPNTTPQPSQDAVIVIVNGKEQYAGKEIKTTEDGKSTVTVEVDNEVIKSKIDEAIKNKTTGTDNVIQVPVVDTKSEVVKVELTGDIVKKLEENTFDVSVKRENVEYVIPAEEFTITKVAENLGVSESDLEDIKVEVKITKLDKEVVKKYNEVAKANGAELVFPPVSFEVVAKTIKADGTTGEVEISKFSNYVERVMGIPEGVDPSKITTGIVFNSDGTYSHVPTVIFQKDGKWYAKLNSLTNSEYSVIWNPVIIESVENHWAKDAVNDLASRLVIFKPESFVPDQAITRAGFAEYIVRALGLYREGSIHVNKFKDVSRTGERTLAIIIANEFGIVTGYPDGTFKPDALITREEAMTMYERAMKVTKLVGTDKNRYQNYTDYKKVGNWSNLYVKDVLSAHVFNGTSTTTISPKSNLTYAEAAQAIKNLLVESNLINK